jgi:hypothetical protein
VLAHWRLIRVSRKRVGRCHCATARVYQPGRVAAPCPVQAGRRRYHRRLRSRGMSTWHWQTLLLVEATRAEPSNETAGLAHQASHLSSHVSISLTGLCVPRPPPLRLLLLNILLVHSCRHNSRASLLLSHQASALSPSSRSSSARASAFASHHHLIKLVSLCHNIDRCLVLLICNNKRRLSHQSLRDYLRLRPLDSIGNHHIHFPHLRRLTLS